jgi:archaellum component FlaG (FlaF/FlaG flagellin family)
MDGWVNTKTLVAFVLGVLLAATVKGLVSQAQSKLGG